jgi:hypothetical protein
VEAHELFFLVVAGIGAGVAVWAGPNAGVAEPAAGIALLATAVLATLVLLPFRRPADAGSWGSSPNPLALLRDSSRQGILGRPAILSSLVGLETDVFGPRRALLSLEEEEHLRKVSAREFRAWVDGRLAELERAS